jgi:hypothetical protein
MLFPTDPAGSDRIAEGELTLPWHSPSMEEPRGCVAWCVRGYFRDYDGECSPFGSILGCPFAMERIRVAYVDKHGKVIGIASSR